MTISRILIVGAGGALGIETVRAVVGRGLNVVATLRTKNDAAECALRDLGAEVSRLDLLDRQRVEKQLQSVDAAIFIPILTVSKNAADLLADGQPAVFFSSNNVAIDPKAEAYAALIDAERETRASAPASIILRPTMIYGYPGDGNISQLMRVMKWLPFAPMPGKGSALQQPIYYKDLAKTAVDVLLDKSFSGQTWAAAGPDAISQRGLYRSIAKAAGVKTPALSIPQSPLTGLLQLSEAVGLKLSLSAAQVRRASLDKTPRGERPIITETPLAVGLAALAQEIRDSAPS